MAYTVVPQAITGGPGLIFSTAITAKTSAPETISGTNLGTNATRGDALQITGNAPNNGVYIVLDVLGANQVEVYPAIPSAATAGGTAQIREQNHKLQITNETTVNTGTIVAAIPDARLFSIAYVLGSSGGLPLNPTYNIVKHVFRDLNLDRTVAGTTTFTIQRECWFLEWDGTKRTGAGITTDWLITETGGTGNIELLVGNQTDAGDPRSVDAGAVLLGCRIAANPGAANFMQVRVLGSFLYNSQASAGHQIGDGQGAGQMSGTVVDGRIVVPAFGGTLETFTDVVNYSRNAGIGVTGPVANADRILQANQTAASTTFFSSTEVIQEGAAFSDACASPVSASFGSAVTFRNPQEDYADARLFSGGPSGAAGVAVRKEYSFNPRFVDISRIAGSLPIAGATVTITKQTDAQYVKVNGTTDGTYTITINGEDHSYVASGATANNIRDGLVTAINAGGQPVTAHAETTTAHLGTAVFIHADVEDQIFVVEVTAPAGNLVLNPALNGTCIGDLMDDDYRPGPVTGSPFTTDANGRINTSGIRLMRAVCYENTTPEYLVVHCQYEIRVEIKGKRLTINKYIPATPFTADLAIEDARMGVISL